MAKTEAIMASTTTHQHAFGDQRFVVLAEAAGLANHYEALGRMEYLWSRCTALGTDTPGLKVLRVFLGKNGSEALLEADLGELMPDGEIRVKGCKGRHEWFGDASPRGAKGGATRAATAPRVAGRFVRAPHPNEPSDPTADDPPPAEPDDSWGPPQITSESPASDQQATIAGVAGPAITSIHHTKYKDQDQDQDQSEIKNPKTGGGERARGRERARSAEPPPTGFVPEDWKPADTPANAAAIAAVPIGVSVERQLKRFVGKMRAKGAVLADIDSEWRLWLDEARPTTTFAGTSRDRAPPKSAPAINYVERRIIEEREQRAAPVDELLADLATNPFYRPKAKTA